MTSVGYQDVLARTLEEHVLFSVLLELTFHCNLDCFFCYNDRRTGGRSLEAEDYARLLVELEEMQVLQITLSGGEPLASPAFWPVGRKARELGFVTRIKTNAHALGGAVARRIQDEIDPYLVEISLHGARAETHDRQTRSSGSFERLMQNVREMQEVGLRISFNATLTHWNEDEIEAMFALADRLGVALAVNPVVSPRDDGDREPLTIAASPGAEELLYRILEERQATPACPEGEPTPRQPATSGRKSCGAGAATLAIDPFGNVFPCVQWRRPMGNVQRQSMREIWTKSSALAEVRSINTAAGERVDRLPLGRKLGFCLGLAEELTGDPLAIYPAAQCKLEILERLENTK